jgi:hypothetical protein
VINIKLMFRGRRTSTAGIVRRQSLLVAEPEYRDRYVVKYKYTDGVASVPMMIAVSNSSDLFNPPQQYPRMTSGRIWKFHFEDGMNNPIGMKFACYVLGTDNVYTPHSSFPLAVPGVGNPPKSNMAAVSNPAFPPRVSISISHIIDVRFDSVGLEAYQQPIMAVIFLEGFRTYS